MYNLIFHVLHDYLGLLSLDYPRYRFYEGRWWTKKQWEAFERQGALLEKTEQKYLQKYFPEAYERRMEAAKHLMENGHLLLPKRLREKIKEDS